MPAVVFPGSGLMLLRRQRSPLGPAFRSGLGPSETEPVLRALLIPAGAGREPASEHRVGLDCGGEPGHGRATPDPMRSVERREALPKLSLVNANSFGVLIHPWWDTAE